MGAFEYCGLGGQSAPPGSLIQYAAHVGASQLSINGGPGLGRITDGLIGLFDMGGRLRSHRSRRRVMRLASWRPSSGHLKLVAPSGNAPLMVVDLFP